MFKQKYIEYLQEQLNSLTPEGYEIKVIEEYSFGARVTSNDRFKIYCFVKFGVGSKQLNTIDRINQPVIFTIKSEAGDFRIAKEIFDNFFLSYSKTVNQLNIDGENHHLWHNYNTPVVQSGIDQVGIHQRMTLILTGVVSYSLSKIIGVKYHLAYQDSGFIEVQAINPQTTYNTQPITPQLLGQQVGYVELEGANNTFTFTMLLDNSVVSQKLLETSILGRTLTLVLKIEYPTINYNVNCQVTSVSNSNDTASGDNILNITLMAK